MEFHHATLVESSPCSHRLDWPGVLLIVLIFLPTPVHDWVISGSIGPVPADVAVTAFIILFTPVTVLSSILRKFDEDFVDEDPAGHDHRATHLPA